MGANTYPRTQVLASQLVTVPANSTVTVTLIGQVVDDFARIVGVAQSNHAVTVNVYQGSGLQSDSALEYVKAYTVAADTDEGGGAGSW